MAKLVTCLIFLSLVNIIRACVNATLLSNYTLTCKDKEAIVERHNYYRQSVGKLPTENMRKLYWDQELTAQAQKLALSCVYDHDSPTIQGQSDVGQIIWQTYTKNKESSSGSIMKFKEQIDAWYQEGLNYTGVTTKEARHFTQLVWADTYKVGCGFSYFKKRNKENTDDYYLKYYVCNYAPEYKKSS